MKSLYDLGQDYDQIFHEQADIAYWCELAGRTGPDVLELGCGTGRLSLPLAEAGHRVTGLDGAQAMLDQARQKAEQAGVDVNWVLGDFTRFELSSRFDLIFLPNNTLGHVLESEGFAALCACVRTHLKPGGVFALDLFVPLPSLLVGNPTPKVFQTYLDLQGQPIEIAESYSYDPATQIKSCLWTYSQAGQIVREHAFTIKIYFPDELRARLEQEGFRIQNQYGDYDRHPFGSGAGKQLYVCHLA